MSVCRKCRCEIPIGHAFSYVGDEQVEHSFSDRCIETLQARVKELELAPLNLQGVLDQKKENAEIRAQNETLKKAAKDTDEEFGKATKCLAETERELEELESRLESLAQRLAITEKCAEILSMYALVLPKECDDKPEYHDKPCPSEDCGVCRAIEACEPYLKYRNAEKNN